MPKNYIGQNPNAPIMIKGGKIYKDPPLTMNRQPFYLERYDFDKIIKTDSSWLCQISLGVGVGLFINMIAKLIANKINPKIQFDEWEIYAFVISLILTVGSYGLDRILPNEKRKIVNHIDGNKHNDFYKNLEWCSYSENALHAFKNNLNHSINSIPGIFFEERRQKWVAYLYRDNKNIFVGRYESQEEAVKNYKMKLNEYNIHKTTIC